MSRIEEKQVDVLAIGAGAAGMTTALVCAIEGLEALVIEKTAYVGGSAAFSAGVCWLPANPWCTRVGVEDTLDAGRTYMRAVLGKAIDEAFVETYLKTAPEAFAYLARDAGLAFEPRRYTPDYWSELPGATHGGRALQPVPFDGALLGRNFKRLRPPPASFMVLGGMMVTAVDAQHLLDRFKSWTAFRHATGLVLRYARDRLSHHRGTRLVMGNALAARLYHGLLQRSVPVWTDTTVTSLIQEGSRVVGALVRTPQGEKRILARKGVVLATGGFPRSPQLRHEHFTDGQAVHSAAPEGNTGDGIRHALSLGAVMGPRPTTPAFWTPVSLVPQAGGGHYRFPHLVMDRSKPGVIAVNAFGQRFVNESRNYHDFARAMLAQRATTGSVSAHLVCSREFLDKYTLGVAYPSRRRIRELVASGYLVEGQTLADLAARINVPPEALVATVVRYNDHARRGEDPEFGKGSTEYNRYLGDASHSPNPCIAPLGCGPYYALRLEPGDIGTCHGLRTDHVGRVLDAHGQPLEGLHAVGNDMNSVMAGEYPAAGITLGPALTFSYALARHLAGKS